MRASLGHAGCALTISWLVVLVYGSFFFLFGWRISGGLADRNVILLDISGLLWILVFCGFVLLYWNILTKPRL
ncbi:NnrS family protein [Bartonella tamiae]|uniref:Uncharacterized protein n=1 Tax=Bartonella tamiae Th239 TaxID=1094558 RepID=J0QTY2_9HYPH|nr:NnrS family protein [Bartonella tamiae]EJF89366.1 hypothetical protein ME5_01917 [Bartonella tamiae Th239]EJF92769.1 hypothetical protein MEG_01939 [Bartonella tamiae Th307]